MATAGMAWWANKQVEQVLADQRERQAERERAAAEARRLQAENERLAAIRDRKAREASRALAREQTRIANAFEDQYQPPPGCANPQSNSRWVECVDLKRNAKAEFMGQQVLLKKPREPIRIAD